MNLQPSDDAFWLSAYFSAQLTFLLTAWLCFRLSIQNKRLFEKPATSESKIILYGFGGAALLFGLSFLVTYLTETVYGNLKDPVIERLLAFSPTYRILFAILGSSIAPICEEILFRRALFGVFRPYGYVTTDIIFSSIIFAVMHFSTFIVIGVFYFIFFIVAGLIFAVIYHKINSILTSILAHILINARSFLLYFYWFT